MKLLKSLAVCILPYSAGEVFDLPRDIKEMRFADSALLSQVKPLNIWVSSGIKSMQKSIVHLPKKQWFVVDSAVVLLVIALCWISSCCIQLQRWLHFCGCVRVHFWKAALG